MKVPLKFENDTLLNESSFCCIWLKVSVFSIIYFAGHFGIINFPYTIINPYFLPEVAKILNRICPACKSFAADKKVKVRFYSFVESLIAQMVKDLIFIFFPWFMVMELLNRHNIR